MPPENENPWQRLGQLLAERRTQIAPRYKNKNLFAEERRLHRRMVWSVESGVRDTYSDGTLRDIESSYMLAPGSIERTIAGGGLEPLQPAPGVPPLRAVPGASPARPVSEAEGILADLLARYEDDPVVMSLGTQDGKAARVMVAEILEWLDFLASRDALPERGTSAG